MDIHEARFGRTVLLATELDPIADAYRAAFGWTTLVDLEPTPGRRFLHVGPASQPGVGLWFLTPEGPEALARVGAQTGGEPTLVLYADDLDAVTAQAVAAGMAVSGEPGADDGSRWRHLRDPLGNRIVLVELAI